MLQAMTKKGRRVTVKTVMRGTRNQVGTLIYGDLRLSWWEPFGHGNRTIEEALKEADDRIDSLRLVLGDD